MDIVIKSCTYCHVTELFRTQATIVLGGTCCAARSESTTSWLVRPDFLFAACCLVGSALLPCEVLVCNKFALDMTLVWFTSAPVPRYTASLYTRFHSFHGHHHFFLRSHSEAQTETWCRISIKWVWLCHV